MKLLFIFLYASVSFALQFTLVNKSEEKRSITIGDFFKAEIEIYSKEELGDITKLADFFQKGELGLFTIVETKNLRASDNNTDVIVADLSLVLREVPKEFLSFEYNKNVYPLSLKGFEIDKSLQPKPHILEQKVSPFDKMNWQYVVLLIFLGPIGYFVKQHLDKKKKVEEAKDRREQALALLKNAKDRGSFELLYKERKTWMEYVDTDSAERYFYVLNKYQYKPEWTESDLLEVQTNCKQIEVIKVEEHA